MFEDRRNRIERSVPARSSLIPDWIAALLTVSPALLGSAIAVVERALGGADNEWFELRQEADCPGEAGTDLHRPWRRTYVARGA